MGSKYLARDSSIYLPNSDIPKNKYNIERSEEIHELEKELLDEAYSVFYEELTEATYFDEKYFIELHRRTFGALYDWAGVYRNFNMSKGESRFCQSTHLTSSSKKIFDELALDNYLRDYELESKEVLAKKIAYYKSELIALHPFCELNGRVTRMFFDLVVVFNGYKAIDYSNVSPAEYIDASIDCVMYADSLSMEKIILMGLCKVNNS